MRSQIWMFLGVVALASCKAHLDEVTGKVVTKDGITIASAGGYLARIIGALKVASRDNVSEEAAKVILSGDVTPQRG